MLCGRSQSLSVRPESLLSDERKYIMRNMFRSCPNIDPMSLHVAQLLVLSLVHIVKSVAEQVFVNRFIALHLRQKHIHTAPRGVWFCG